MTGAKAVPFVPRFKLKAALQKNRNVKKLTSVGVQSTEAMFSNGGYENYPPMKYLIVPHYSIRHFRCFASAPFLQQWRAEDRLGSTPEVAV
jgi:hypothetical protein